jgi:hypothetical protein
MSSDDELMLIFGVLHLIALVLGVVLFAMFLSSGSGSDRNSPEDDDSGGGNDRLGDHRPPKTSPSGGIPLPDAEPSPVRLRGPGRLADAYRHERRRVVEPAQPGRRRVAV